MLTSKEIAKFYLGCDFKITTPEGEVVYMKVDNIGIDGTGWLCGDDFSGRFVEIDPFSAGVLLQPILWPITQISNVSTDWNEYKKLCNFVYDDRKRVVVSDTPLSIAWLISKRYDAFDLIDCGMAINMVEYLENDRKTNRIKGNRI